MSAASSGLPARAMAATMCGLAALFFAVRWILQGPLHKLHVHNIPICDSHALL